MWEGRAECGHERPARASPERTLAKIFNELKVLICSELAAASVPASAAGRGTGHRRLPPKLRGPAMLHRHAPRGANLRN